MQGNPAGTAGSQPAHGHAQGRAIPFADPANRTRVLLIASGKGGVGKSSVTTNLSIALAQRGRKVGVIDADVWGFSIPRMLGIAEQPVVIDSMLLPPEANGVRATDVARGSTAWQLGLRARDVIVAVNRQPVADFNEFTDALKGSAHATVLALKRGDEDVRIVLP